MPPHRVELSTLQIAALGVGDLIRRAATLHLAGDEIDERDAPIGQRVAVFAAVTAAIAMLRLLRARLVADMLGVRGEFGMAGGRRCVAEPQIDIDPLQALSVVEESCNHTLS